MAEIRVRICQKWYKGRQRQHEALCRHEGKGSLIDIGDVVFVHQRKTGRLSTPFHPRPLVITNRKGSMVTARRQDGLPHEVAGDHPVIDDKDAEDETEMAVPPETQTPGRDHEWETPPVMAIGSRKSAARPRKPTQRLQEQV
ncbi:hypothetical protein LSAT2_013553 [Lamellibrachia satsuma]|nr:hypothetical protein LSAT2_013553 [Lamellibrachia satsuma]